MVNGQEAPGTGQVRAYYIRMGDWENVRLVERVVSRIDLRGRTWYNLDDETPCLTWEGEMTLLEEFSRGLEGKEISKLIHEAKAESESRILGQGIAYLALFISEVMVEAIAASSRGEFRYPFVLPAEQYPTPSRG